MTDTAVPTSDAPRLDASGLLSWARLCAQRLGELRDEINGLNVFPVPDSDTGTNLLHTMRAAVRRAEEQASRNGEEVRARDVALELGYGAVHGARGNSGVLLSQVLRAVGEAATVSDVDATTFRQALRTAVSLMGRALSEPVEGTILSVLRAASDAAAGYHSTQLADVVRAAADAAAEALEETPSQLAVLREAGVVDAGGRGLLVLLDSLVESLTGRRPDRREYRARRPAPTRAPSESPEPVETFRYEVMYLLTDSADDRTDDLRAALTELGDSVVLSGDGRPSPEAAWTVHVHTNEIGAAIEAGLGAGRVSDIRVADLFEEDTGHVPGSGDDDPDAPPPASERSVVAVAPGGRLCGLFAESGAEVITADAPTDDLVRQLVDIGSPELVVLPNGELGQQQIVDLDAGVRAHGRHILIVPTSSVVQGLAALAVHDPDMSLSLDVFAMADAASSTRHARIITAEKDAITLVGPCKAGDLLGVVGHDVAVIGSEPAGTVCGLVDRFLSSGGELVTLLIGDAFDDEGAEAVRCIEKSHPEAEVVSFPVGGSDVVAYIGVE